MLSFNDVACRRDGKLLFSQISCVIHAGQKVGLTGANGCGKSSLFAMIQGHLEPDTGSITRPQNVGITHVAQEMPNSDSSALDYVVDGDQMLRKLEAAISACGDQDGERIATLLGEFEQAGGYTITSRAGALLHGLGFSIDSHSNPVSSFSGGWRMRLNLAQALISPNELLMLDEPTNHLDLDAVLWLETWLKQREGTLILVSHDREFLDSITSNTFHIESKTGNLITGNYSAFERWRAARMVSQQALHEKTEARRKELQGFVDRFRAQATKARQAQSRLKMLERLGDTQAVQIESPFTFSFKTPKAMPSPLVVLDKADVGYDQNIILKGIDFTILSGDRIGLLGVNGAGKSTLIKSLTGDLALSNGKRTPAQKLKIGYFAQHQVDQLRGDQSALQALISHDKTFSESEARTYLGGFGFHGEQALQSAATLSGGERARLALALIVSSQPNLLLLDEPTNHLDINMRQALANALVSFEGALIVISHDRTMLRSVVDELWLVADGSLKPFDDDLDGYAKWLAKRRALEASKLSDPKNQKASADSSQAASAQNSTADNEPSVAPVPELSAVDRQQQKREQAALRAQLTPLKKAVASHEKKLEGASKELDKVREALSADDIYSEQNKQQLATLLKQEGEARAKVDSIEELLLESMEVLEKAGG